MTTDTIRYSETLDYCDGIQLFAAYDPAGRLHIAILVAIGTTSDRYLVARCAMPQLRLWQSGDIDLKTLLQQSAKAGWHLADVADFGKPIALQRRQTTPVPDKFLPAAGFYLADTPPSVRKTATAAYPGA